MSRMLSLAAGCVLDLSPADTVSAAADAGFDAAGIWFDAGSWSAATTREVAGRLQSTGLTALDVEGARASSPTCRAEACPIDRSGRPERPGAT